MRTYVEMTVVFLAALLLVVGVTAPAMANELHSPMGDVVSKPSLQDGGTPGDTTVPTETLDDQTAQQIWDILIVILVLSIAFEVALTPIFNWSIFIKYGADKGLRTPISVGLALIAFWVYDLDVFRDLINAMSPGAQVPITFFGKFLTALLIAGGSGTVYQVFNRLGIQNYQKRKDEVEGRTAEAQPSTEPQPSAPAQPTVNPGT